ncbi:L,D-transpeptidase [Marinobacter panjinensis]|uniref:L,D-transpeptidase n=1 Tax=Marinobacter panjinensis TaxID=2576384 RepID=A0A4U6R1D9_9GAMM|nr:L,D-transpeptidase [Marinobacter panjinensis]MCR8913848.1 L,D-transpeptidase [Marinobacter panjinensis]TKV67514.1 L,D-transpeptidase [Marinobacter panjinensis]
MPSDSVSPPVPVNVSGTAPGIEIDLARQTLTLFPEDATSSISYPVSTALNGPGERHSSGCTPRGSHYVRAMVGGGVPLNSVFVARRPTGEVYSADLARQFPERDWILSRILWLCGLESGKNRGPGVDSFRRFIYIHGTPDSEPMGAPRSHGCIRMRNADVVDLYSRVRPGTTVLIR